MKHRESSSTPRRTHIHYTKNRTNRHIYRQINKHTKKNQTLTYTAGTQRGTQTNIQADTEILRQQRT